MYNTIITDDKIIISENTPLFSHGFQIEFDKITSADCLRFMDKFKRLYYEKLKQSVEVKNNE